MADGKEDNAQAVIGGTNNGLRQLHGLSTAPPPLA